MPFNPTIHRIGDQFVLLYIANAGGKRPQRVSTQRIGMQVADRIEGPWRKVNDDGLLLSPPEVKNIWCHDTTVGVNNPALLAHPDGRFFLCFKAKNKGDVRRMGLAIADRVEGPYVIQPEPMTSNSSEIEDGYAFTEGENIQLITTHNKAGAGYLWNSKDGLTFGKPVVGFETMNRYLSKDQMQKSKKLRSNKFERPQVLMQDGKPTHLFVASGANFNGGDGSVSCVLRIKP